MIKMKHQLALKTCKDVLLLLEGFGMLSHLQKLSVDDSLVKFFWYLIPLWDNR